MAASGGQPGNQNARKAKRWENALLRALARKANSVDAGLDKVADQVVDAACKGEKEAWQEIGNRLDGKPHQSVDMDVGASEGLLAVLANLKARP